VRERPGHRREAGQPEVIVNSRESRRKAARVRGGFAILVPMKESKALAVAAVLLLSGCPEDRGLVKGPHPTEAKPEHVEGKPEPRPAPISVPRLEAGFAAFSADGAQLAYVTHSAGAGTDVLTVADAAGQKPPETTPLPDAAAREAALRRLEGFAPLAPVPSGAVLMAELAATPPAATVAIGAHKSAVRLDEKPFPSGATAVLAGASTDGHHLAIRIEGKSPAGADPFTTYRVVATPRE
jgi:hypothetical protein